MRALRSPTSETPPDQALASHRRLALGDAPLGAHRDQDAAHEGAARIADHPAGDLADLGVGREVEQAAQRLVLGVEPARRLLPLLKPGELGAQHAILLVDVDRALDLAKRPGHRLGRLADHAEHGGQHVEHRRAHTLDHDDLGLAEQHQGERRRHQGQERETSHRRP